MVADVQKKGSKQLTSQRSRDCTWEKIYALEDWEIRRCGSRFREAGTASYTCFLESWAIPFQHAQHQYPPSDGQADRVNLKLSMWLPWLVGVDLLQQVEWAAESPCREPRRELDGRRRLTSKSKISLEKREDGKALHSIGVAARPAGS